MPIKSKQTKGPNNISTERFVPWPEDRWSENERWVWQQIHSGNKASFSKRYKNYPKPHDEAYWCDEERKRRGLNSKFIETILLFNPWMRAIGKNTLAIEGAYIVETLEFRGCILTNQIFFESCRFENSILCPEIRAERGLHFTDCFIKGKVDFVSGSFLTNIRLEYCNVPELELSGLEVGGQISLMKSKVKKDIHLSSVNVRCGIFLAGLTTGGAVRIVHSDISSAINIAQSKIAQLDLRATNVVAVWDDPDCWPPVIQLEGFKYNSIYGKDEKDKETDSLSDRSIAWIKNWLDRQPNYRSQPYQQCAKVLREAGQPWKAAEVLFAGKEREREDAIRNNQKARARWLAFLKYSIGYGLTKRFVIRPALWALALLVMGFFIFWFVPGASSYRWWWALGYSLNRLLPVVDLHPGFAKLHPLGFFPGAWFLFQTLCGWALALLIAAGLAGVGKPGGRD